MKFLRPPRSTLALFALFGVWVSEHSLASGPSGSSTASFEKLDLGSANYRNLAEELQQAITRQAGKDAQKRMHVAHLTLMDAKLAERAADIRRSGARAELLRALIWSQEMGAWLDPEFQVARRLALSWLLKPGNSQTALSILARARDPQSGRVWSESGAAEFLRDARAVEGDLSPENVEKLLKAHPGSEWALLNPAIRQYGQEFLELSQLSGVASLTRYGQKTPLTRQIAALLPEPLRIDRPSVLWARLNPLTDYYSLSGRVATVESLWLLRLEAESLLDLGTPRAGIREGLFLLLKDQPQILARRSPAEMTSALVTALQERLQRLTDLGTPATAHVQTKNNIAQGLANLQKLAQSFSVNGATGISGKVRLPSGRERAFNSLGTWLGANGAVKAWWDAASGAVLPSTSATPTPQATLAVAPTPTPVLVSDPAKPAAVATPKSFAAASAAALGAQAPAPPPFNILKTSSIHGQIETFQWSASGSNGQQVSFKFTESNGRIRVSEFSGMSQDPDTSRAMVSSLLNEKRGMDVRITLNGPGDLRVFADAFKGNSADPDFSRVPWLNQSQLGFEIDPFFRTDGLTSTEEFTLKAMEGLHYEVDLVIKADSPGQGWLNKEAVFSDPIFKKWAAAHNARSLFSQLPNIQVDPVTGKASIVLFGTDGRTHPFYNQLAYQLEGARVSFSDGKSFELGRLLGSGNTTYIYEIAGQPGRVLRIPRVTHLEKGVLVPKRVPVFIADYLEGHRALAEGGVNPIEIYSSKAGQYIEVEKIRPRQFVDSDGKSKDLVLNSFLRDPFRFPDWAELEAKLLDFAREIRNFASIADFHGEQVVFDAESQRWRLLDWAKDGMERWSSEAGDRNALSTLIDQKIDGSRDPERAQRLNELKIRLQGAIRAARASDGAIQPPTVGQPVMGPFPPNTSHPPAGAIPGPIVLRPRSPGPGRAPLLPAGPAVLIPVQPGTAVGHPRDEVRNPGTAVSPVRPPGPVVQGGRTEEVTLGSLSDKLSAAYARGPGQSGTFTGVLEAGDAGAGKRAVDVALDPVEADALIRNGTFPATEVVVRAAQPGYLAPNTATVRMYVDETSLRPGPEGNTFVVSGADLAKASLTGVSQVWLAVDSRAPSISAAQYLELHDRLNLSLQENSTGNAVVRDFRSAVDTYSGSSSFSAELRPGDRTDAQVRGILGQRAPSLVDRFNLSTSTDAIFVRPDRTTLRVYDASASTIQNLGSAPGTLTSIHAVPGSTAGTALHQWANANQVFANPAEYDTFRQVSGPLGGRYFAASALNFMISNSLLPQEVASQRVNLDSGTLVSRFEWGGLSVVAVQPHSATSVRSGNWIQAAPSVEVNLNKTAFAKAAGGHAVNFIGGSILLEGLLDVDNNVQHVMEQVVAGKSVTVAAGSAALDASKRMFWEALDYRTYIIGGLIHAGDKLLVYGSAGAAKFATSPVTLGLLLGEGLNAAGSFADGVRRFDEEYEGAMSAYLQESNSLDAYVTSGVLKVGEFRNAVVEQISDMIGEYQYERELQAQLAPGANAYFKDPFAGSNVNVNQLPFQAQIKATEATMTSIIHSQRSAQSQQNTEVISHFASLESYQRAQDEKTREAYRMAAQVLAQAGNYDEHGLPTNEYLDSFRIDASKFALEFPDIERVTTRVTEAYSLYSSPIEDSNFMDSLRRSNPDRSIASGYSLWDSALVGYDFRSFDDSNSNRFLPSNYSLQLDAITPYDVLGAADDRWSRSITADFRYDSITDWSRPVEWNDTNFSLTISGRTSVSDPLMAGIRGDLYDSTYNRLRAENGGSITPDIFSRTNAYTSSVMSHITGTSMLGGSTMQTGILGISNQVEFETGGISLLNDCLSREGVTCRWEAGYLRQYGPGGSGRIIARDLDGTASRDAHYHNGGYIGTTERSCGGSFGFSSEGCPCTANFSCNGSSETCVDGICKKRGLFSGCDDHQDCSFGELCQNRGCRRPEDISCYNDWDCGFGYSCLDRRCRRH